MQPDLFHQAQQENYKKAIIVGASSGMGKELCRILVREGYRVGIAGRRENLLKELQSESPERIFYRAFDIRDMSKSARGLRELIRELDGLDLLVMSSGTGFINEELDPEPEFQTIDTNVTAFTDIMTFAYRYFKKHPPGHISAITSVAALRGNATAPAYNASKAYQSNYLEALRLKSRKSGDHIVVTDIRPGFVNTDMARGERLFWVASPAKAAHLIFRAIKRKKRVAYVSRRWRLLAILLKFSPRWMYEKL
jgi:short-subunit dehydrogenase